MSANESNTGLVLVALLGFLLLSGMPSEFSHDRRSKGTGELGCSVTLGRRM